MGDTQQESRAILADVSVIDADGFIMQRDAYVVIGNGWVAEVGDTAGVQARPDDNVIDVLKAGKVVNGELVLDQLRKPRTATGSKPR